MRQYEVMVIIDPDVDDRQVNGLLEKPLAGLTKAGGTVDSLDIWGRRRLAYDIRKKSEGIYAVLTITADPADVKELDRQFTLNEQIMRTKVLRAEEAIALIASEKLRADEKAARKAARPPKPVKQDA